MGEWVDRVAMWLLSRLFIAAVMLLITPLLPAPSGGIKPSWLGSLLGGIVSYTTRLPL